MFGWINSTAVLTIDQSNTKYDFGLKSLDAQKIYFLIDNVCTGWKEMPLFKGLVTFWSTFTWTFVLFIAKCFLLHVTLLRITIKVQSIKEHWI